MVSLIAKSPLQGRAPVTLAGITLSERLLGRVTSVALLKGQKTALGRVLKGLGLGFPDPNRMRSTDSAQIVWTGREQAFLIEADPAGLAGMAALTDQSDGWAALTLAGEGAADLLMRLYPIDLRLPAFGTGHAARAPMGHMSSVVMRMADDRFDLLVFRSMAQTAWHEVEDAMKKRAARIAAGC